MDLFVRFCVHNISLEHKLKNLNGISTCFCFAEPSGLHAVDGGLSDVREEQRG